MTRRIWVVIVVALLWPGAVLGGEPAVARGGHQSVSTSCGAGAEDGLIVYGEIDPGGGDRGGLASSALVVMTLDGEDVARVGLAGFERWVPLGVGCTVLVNRTAGGSVLVDAATGTARALALPADKESTLFPAPWWRRNGQDERWALLAEGDPASGVLLDTETGEGVDLATLIARLRGAEDANQIFFASGQVSKDGSHLLLGVLGERWLIPTADPDSGRRLTDFGTGLPEFSDDGQTILFGETVGGAVARVVIESLDGSDREIVADGDRSTRAFWVPGGDAEQILLVQDTSVAVRRLADGSERVVTTLSDDQFVQHVIVAPSGRRVLLRTLDDVSAARWTWLDLDDGRSQVISLLDEYDPPIVGPGPGARWRAFFPPSIEAGAEPGAAVISLDLETGQPRRVLVIGEERVFFIPAAPASFWSADGRWGLVNDFGERTPRTWLIDAERGQATELPGALGSGVTADGETVLISEQTDDGETPSWRLVRMANDGGDRQVVRESVAAPAIWVR